MTDVYVVTDGEMGWDCVMGAYSSSELAELAASQRGEQCVVSCVSLETEKENSVETCYKVIKASHLHSFEVGEEVYISRFDFSDGMHEYTSFENKDKIQWLEADEVEEIEI